MALNSVNTNVGALVALQNLNATNNELNVVQNRINTGKKVGNAKDNGAIWAIAQGQRSDVASLAVVKDSLQRGQSVIDVGLAAGETVSDLLVEMKAKALAASDVSLGTQARIALNNDFKALRDQLAKAVSEASFDGINPISGTGAGNTYAVRALGNADGTSAGRIEVLKQNLGLGGANVTLAATASFNPSATAAVSSSTAAGILATVDGDIARVSRALASLGTGSKALGSHLNFISKLSDTLEAGVGNLVDADLAKESARLQALQTKQQLGIQALAIANSSTGSILGLFR
jgi:flagellin